MAIDNGYLQCMGYSCPSSDSLAKQISVHRTQVATQPDVVCNRTPVHPFPPPWASEFCKQLIFLGNCQPFVLCLACFTSPILPLVALFGLYIWAAERACISWHFIPVLPATSKPVMACPQQGSKAVSCHQRAKSIAGCCAERRQREPLVPVLSRPIQPDTGSSVGRRGYLY